MSSGLQRKIALIRKTVRTVRTTPATTSITLILWELVWTATITDSHRLRHMFSNARSYIQPHTHPHTHIQTTTEICIHTFLHIQMQIPHISTLHFFTLSHMDTDWYPIQIVFLCLNTNAAVLSYESRSHETFIFHYIDSSC